MPEGWLLGPAKQMRVVTLIRPLERGFAEMYISESAGGGELANVNRWRGQLRLPPTDAQQLSGESKSIDLEGSTATLVNLVGHAVPNTMGRPPFASGAPNGN